MMKRTLLNTLKTAAPFVAAFAMTLSGSPAVVSPLHAGQLAVPEKTEPPVPPPGHRVIDLTPGSKSARAVRVEVTVAKPRKNDGKSESKYGKKQKKKSDRTIVEVHDD